MNVDDLIEQWKVLASSTTVVPSYATLYAISSQVGPHEEALDVANVGLHRLNRADWREWMPCHVADPQYVKRTYYVNVNPKSAMYDVYLLRRTYGRHRNMLDVMDIHHKTLSYA